MTFKAKPAVFAQLLCLAALGAIGAQLTTAQAATHSYPERPVKVLFPWMDGFPANSARLFAEGLSQRLKQPVLVDVRAGAGGEVAARQVVNAPADGYTLLATGSSITIRSVLDDKNVDGLRDLQPIGRITTTPYVLVAKTGKFGTFSNLVAQAKAAPGKFNFASAGVGTGMHYLGELINEKAGIEIVHVPYATGSRQLLAINSGDIDVAIISLVTALPHIQSGSLEALVVSSASRSRALPNVPTLAESGINGVPDLGAWIAFFGPKNMPADALKLVSEQIQDISQDPKIQATVASWGAELPDSSIEALDSTIKAEKASWESVIRKLESPI